MAWNYRKSVRIARGVRLNLSKSGMGFSYGIPGYRITKSANGRVTRTKSIPGTGLSKRETLAGPTNRKIKDDSNSVTIQTTPGMFRENGSVEPSAPLITEQIEVSKKPKKFWTVVVGLILIGAIGADFGKTSPEGPSRLASVIYSLFWVALFSYRIYRHKNPRKVVKTRVRVLESELNHLESEIN